MKDGLEIERKWLLGMLPDRYKSHDALTIVQLYGRDEFGWFRLRMQYGQDYPTTCFLTRKTSIIAGINREVENEITQDEFDERLCMCSTKLDKTRFLYNHGGLLFEVDVYEKLTLITLEVELQDIEQEIEIPSFIKQCIIKEVTGDSLFSNYNLSKLLGEHKYKSFNKI